MSCCCGSDDEEEQRPDTPRVRGCTDVFWLCLFVLFWVVMIIIAAFAFVYGHPIKLINGYDTFGNICGIKNQKLGNWELSGQDNTDKPYLFFMDGTNLKKSLKICVKICPNRQLGSIRDVCTFYKETDSQLCHEKPGNTFSACNNYRNPDNITGSCNSINYPVSESIPILNRCITKKLIEVGKGISSNLTNWIKSWDTIEQILSDLYKTWKQILVFSVMAFVLSILVIGIFHVLASVVTWIIMILVIIACSIGTGLLWWTYFDIKKTLEENSNDPLLEETIKNKQAFFVLAVIATIVTFILFFLLCLIRKKLSFMADLFKESAECLAELPGLFFAPLTTFIALIIYYAFWVTVILCLATASYPQNMKAQHGLKPALLNSSGLTDNSMPIMDQKALNHTFDEYRPFTIVEYVPLKWIKYMWWIYFIGLIWMSEFITACETMVISGAVAHWYFRGKNASVSPVCSSVGNLLAYHLGSVACGSLLITIFKIPRIILTYLHMKFEKTRETSPCAQCGLKCCICCFYCLEKFIRYMNHNAYTVIAIEGTHFCNAARIAFTTIISNALQVAVINGIGDFFLFLGKCVVTAVTGSIALLYLKRDPNLHFYAAPVFVTCVTAFFIAHCVISLYETIIDTLFLCICEDKNLNGDNGKWRHSSLAKFNESTTTNGQHELAPMNN